MSSESPRPPPGARLSWLWLLAGGLLGATLCTLLGVPAGGIVGAVLGSAAVSIRAGGRLPDVPPAGRISGLVLLGCAAGVRLEPATLLTLLHLAVPLLGAVLLLLLLDVALALALARWCGLDRTTALFACAPGGLSEITAVAEEQGARLGIVVAVHVVRVVLVVALLLPVMLAVLGS